MDPPRDAHPAVGHECLGVAHWRGKRDASFPRELMTDITSDLILRFLATIASYSRFLLASATSSDLLPESLMGATFTTSPASSPAVERRQRSSCERSQKMTSWMKRRQMLTGGDDNERMECYAPPSMLVGELLPSEDGSCITKFLPDFDRLACI